VSLAAREKIMIALDRKLDCLRMFLERIVDGRSGTDEQTGARKTSRTGASTGEAKVLHPARPSTRTAR
jgi:hypothetical protein